MKEDPFGYGEQPNPHVFIQWKGTDACFDFHCACGAFLHWDGYFAYYVQCGVCEAVWQMPFHLYPRPATADDSPLVRLEPDDGDGAADSQESSS